MKMYGVITLILLGLCIQASSTANTMQSYYIELHIESSALDRFTWLLGNITEVTVRNGTAKITDITITTDCQFSICTCSPNYSWSEMMCKMHPECCKYNNCPTNAMCLHKNKVNVNGSFTIPNGTLSDVQKEKLIMEMKSIYSTMNWFDSLEITSLRPGSINGDFVMSINGPVELEHFLNLTKNLPKAINASTVNIITTGFIKINSPGMIGYNTDATITCTSPVSTLDDVKWYIQNDPKKQRITNGTVATVSRDSLRSIVHINQTSEVWKGTFICDYKVSEKFTSIIHRASVFLDIALLPQIFITSDPQFPDCKTDKRATIEVIVKCIIKNSTEPYNVTWSPNNYETNPTSEEKSTIYINKILINCEETQDIYTVSCAFKNRANNTENATLIIPVIKDRSVVCQGNDEWPTAKANFSAKMQCNSNEVGFKLRKCTGFQNPGTWEPINSKCVTTDIWSLLIEAQNLQAGHGLVEENANKLFDLLKKTSEDELINTFSNINASVYVLNMLNNASETQNHKFNETVLTNFLKSSSNLLNDSLLNNWNSPVLKTQTDVLPSQYLRAVEGFVNRFDMIMDKPHSEENVELIICNTSVDTCKTAFNITFDSKTEGRVCQTRISNLLRLLPQLNSTSNATEYILSVTRENMHTNLGHISMNFPNQRRRNHRIICVFFNFTTNEWSGEGCNWGGALKPNVCTCNHLSAFTSLMSQNAVELLYMKEITFTGLGFSICSLVLCLAIEFVVWNTVVKSTIAHFRHTVLVNIALCLLIAHCSFVASSIRNSALSQWCLTFTVMKHFCFLAVFFWMLCMSLGLLHQMIYIFVSLRKKVYLGSCFFLGYICPLIIVICTVITCDNGALDSYYVNDTCWLKYDGLLQGSIHSFIIPAGIIVLVNMFTMVVVISRILKPTLSEGKSHDEKEIIRSVIRSVVLLTPSLGITWIFGFCIPIIDNTMEPFAQIINYTFALFNSFQGFFILLTGCLGEKKVRDALLVRIQSQHSAHYTSKSSMTKMAAVKKK